MWLHVEDYTDQALTPVLLKFPAIFELFDRLLQNFFAESGN